MNNKGFTLVEILGVIVILIIVFILVYPAVNNIISQSKDTVYQKQINNILNSAYDLSLKKINYLPDYQNKTYITLGELKSEGLIDVNVKNPETKENFPDSLVISINNVGAGYEYSNKNSKLEGDYLYTVEIDNLNNPEIVNLLPTIILNNLTKNSDGNYIKTLDLNEEVPDFIYTAVSHDNIDLTDIVKNNIVINNTVVDKIDSSVSGIYKVSYSVVDQNGYANSLILSVIIADTTQPIITFPEDNTLNKNVTSYNLLNGVICEDNSGFCDITTNGKIEFGVEGKYVIEYTAKDPSGNTTIKKRIITIE